MTTKKKIILACLAVLAVPVLFYGYWGIRLVVTAKNNGFFDAAQKREYTGDTVKNLQAIHTALMLYQDSEGALPEASGWMDAAWSRLQTADMEEDEAKKKLKSQGITADNEFGYGFNDAVSAKHTLDLPDTTILVFESKDLAWNAHGKPANPGAKAITITGKIVDLK